MDLTERKRAEEALRASEKNYRALMEQAPDGIFISDHLGNIYEEAAVMRWITLTTLTVIGLTTLYLVDSKYRAQVHQENARALAQASAETQHRIRVALATRLGEVEDLRAFMLAPATLPDNETINRFAANVLKHNPLSTVGYIDPNRIVRYIYPLKGNEQAIGLDLMTRPAAPFVEKAIRERRTTVNDPTIGITGLLSLTSRTPLFQGDQLLGLVFGSFQLPPFLEEVSTGADPRFAVQLQDANGHRFGGVETISGETQTLPIQVGDNAWTLTVGWHSLPPEPAPLTLGLVWGVGGALLLSLLFIVNRTWTQTEWLRTTVSARTAALRESEGLFRTLVNASSQSVWRYRPGSPAPINQIDSASAAWWREFTGQTEAQRTAAGGMGWLDAVCEEDRASAQRSWLDLLNTSEPVRALYRARRQDGEWRWLSHYGLPYLFDAQGVVTEWAGTVSDITERMQAEAALRESEERYRDLVENSRELICTHDLDGLVLSANRASAEALEYDSNELLEGKNIRDILAPEVRDQFDEYIARLSKDGATSGFMLVQTLSGERRVWEYYNSLRTEGVATPIVRGMARDITDRKRAEMERAVISEVIQSVNLTANLDELLKHVHQSLKRVLYAENCCVALYDKQTGLFEAPFFVDLVEANPFPMTLSKNCTARVFSTGQPLLMNEAILDELLDRGEVELIGRPAPSFLAAPLMTPAETIGVIVVQHYEKNNVYSQRDVEFLSAVAAQLALAIERKRAEEALKKSENDYRQLFDSANDAILIFESEGEIILEANNAACEVYGYSRDELIGRSLKRLTKSVLAGESQIKELLDAGTSSNYESIQFNNKGEEIYFLINASVIDYKDRQAILSINHNITERKQAEESLRQLSGRLLHLQDEERRRIARELHDTTAQSLAALTMNLSVLDASATTLEPKARKALSQSLALAESSSREIRTLSYLLHPPLLDEAGLMSAVRWYTDGFSERSGIAVDLDITSEIGRLPSDVEITLFRIVQEALTNVHHHAASKSVRIRLERISSEVSLEIKDKGHGIPPETLKSIRTGIAKIGVGIAGMRERVNQLGGRLEINSSKRGTSVRVILPVGGGRS